jgi:hypothetical protein
MDPSGNKPFELTPALKRCFGRHRKDYATLSATPDSFKDFVEAVSQLQRTQPNYSASDLARIRVPVRIVHAAHDEFIKSEHAEYLARSIQGHCIVSAKHPRHCTSRSLSLRRRGLRLPAQRTREQPPPQRRSLTSTSYKHIRRGTKPAPYSRLCQLPPVLPGPAVPPMVTAPAPAPAPACPPTYLQECTEVGETKDPHFSSSFQTPARSLHRGTNDR